MTVNLDFGLPETGREPSPAFDSVNTCRDWLAAQPMANAVHTQTLLLRQLNLLNRYDIEATKRLELLELLRDPIAYVQSDSAPRFAGRPLPLSAAEQVGLNANRALWQALQLGYLHCLQACLDGEPHIQPHAALAAHRALAAMRAELIDLCRAPTDPAAGFWQTVHRIYAAAERREAASKPVIDKLQTAHPASSVASGYTQMLLLCRADPFELSTRQLAYVQRWLERWGGKVVVLAAEPETPRVPPLVVDLDSDRPEGDAHGEDHAQRWLDLSEISRSVKKRIVRLQQGESPASLGLGEDILPPACEKLLKRLYQCWFKGGIPRYQPRHGNGGACRLVATPGAIHYCLSGHKFRQPGGKQALSRLQAEEIAMFGRIAARHQEDSSQTQGSSVEAWQVLDESAAGLRLTREIASADSRIGGGHLLAIQPPGSNTGFLLAVARWSRITSTNELQAGVGLLPGTPQPVAVRVAGASAANEKFHPGFVLPAVAALNEPESVILPAGWFRPQLVVELFADSSRRIRLFKALDRGSDFDRATFDEL